ncbi:hypothetical protein [Isoptericola sp. NPDC056134]|uniref:hypothetical protein n=1 Tax=Isoptericola sp. NPDC056134 TaxID=3345723 RepID=UPI0035F0D464
MSDRESTLRAWAASSNLEDRLRAADEESLPADVVRTLLLDPDEQVVGSVLFNYTIPRELLAEARKLPLSPEQMDQVAEHQNAPFDLAEKQPLWKHTYVSITSYCEGKGLGEAVRDRIAHAWAELEPGPGGLTLAEAVDAAR